MLTKLSSALASEHDGAHPAPDATRARIMARLAAEKRKKRRRWVLWTPLFALGIGSTALAASDGSLVSALASIPKWVRSLTPSEETSEMKGATAARAGQPTSELKPGSEPSQVALADAKEVPADATEEPEPGPGSELALETGGDVPGPVHQKATSVRPRARAEADQNSQSAHARPETQVPASTPAAPAETPPGAEPLGLDVYRKAHDAQFRSRDCRAALDGYAAYLRESPSGALRIEASYNTALCEIELGLVARARRSLTPFARGSYGSYRQEEARALLEALDAKAPE